MNKTIIAFAAFVILNILDFVTTKISLSYGGEEVNPIMVYVMNTFQSVNAILYVKLVVLAMIGSFLLWTDTSKRKQLFPLFVFCNIFYLFVVANNTWTIYKLII